MVLTRPKLLVLGASLATAALLVAAFLRMTDVAHPFEYLEGRANARRQIERGKAVWIKYDCVAGEVQIDDATGLPILVTGTLSPNGVAYYRGYDDEIHRALAQGRLESSSVRQKVRTRETALQEYTKGPRIRIARGDPPVASPDGRYRLLVARASGDKNDVHPTYCLNLQDTRWNAVHEFDLLGVPTSVTGVWTFVDAIEIVPYGDWTCILLRRESGLDVIDLSRGYAIQCFDFTWPPEAERASNNGK